MIATDRVECPATTVTYPCYNMGVARDLRTTHSSGAIRGIKPVFAGALLGFALSEG